MARVRDFAQGEAVRADAAPQSAAHASAHSDGFVHSSIDISLDPFAGSDAPNGKLIYTPDEAADNLNRYDVNWTYGNYGALDDGVLTFDFWTPETFANSYFYELRYTNGEAFNDDAYYAEEYGFFEGFNAAQQVAAAANVELWDDLISIEIHQAQPGDEADIMFGAVYMGAAAGAHAYYPQAEALDEAYGSTEYGKTSGDVMINWLYNSPTGEDGRPADTSFSALAPGDYGWFAVTHELGHSFGLAHGGDYNATDDNDGDGEADPITYDSDAYFYQDSQQYTIMSYFDGSVTGAGYVDWKTLTFKMPATPMVHDILAVQNVYGADMTTRAGDTVYGFNSTAGNDVFDFAVNKAPVVTIWDGGGNDTLDLSGWSTDELIDLHQGAFSSASDGASLAYLKSIGFLPESYTQDKLEALFASYNTGPQGQMHDNIGIAYGAVIENAVGGGGNDVILGNEVGNRLVGNAGNDLLNGGSGNDSLLGGTGNDRLIGGTGRDVLTGGSGNDVFVGELDAAGKVGTKAGNISVDIITDFQHGSDKIDLAAIDARIHSAGDQAFSFGGTSANKSEGDLTYKTYGNINAAEHATGIDLHGIDGAGAGGPVTVVYGNVDGGSPDFAIVLLNHSGVMASDFIF